MKKDRRNNVLYYLSVMLIAALLFCLIYGPSVLKPWYTAWLFGQGDIEQHYLGWVGYRLSSWKFPFGLTDQLAYPLRSSVVFTDSIPLLAVPFKILSFILPKHFQYFGLWGVMCYMLQALIGVRICEKFSSGRLYNACGGLLMCLMPAFIQRMYVHSSLAGHFILLLAILAFVSYKDDVKGKSGIIFVRWGVIALLCASVHVYLLLMCGIILTGYILLDIMCTRKIVRPLLLLGLYLGTAAGVLGLLGGFSGGNDPFITGDLGECGFNLNSFFNPLYHSSLFFGELPTYSNNAENYAYLGLGVFALILSSAVFFIISKKRTDKRVITAAAVIFVISLVFAASPVITLGESKLFEIPCPDVVTRIWSIFRATGRVIWIDVYLIEVSCLYIIAKSGKKTAGAIVLAAVLCLQAADIFPLMASKHEDFSGNRVYVNMVTSLDDKWDEIASTGRFSHVFMTDVYDAYDARRFAVTAWAFENDMTVNQFLISRYMFSREDIDGSMFPLSDDTLYVAYDASVFEGTELTVVPVGGGYYIAYI